ncbi:MAG: hypothetical protein UX16_C0008G0017 [Parcubacteria group bacterium GW2011_GWB1_45_7]|uniref:HD domain-containing protein n=1 Tax=Candidatus Colwellbacteria bacterium RIFCSPLOWO2_02_FULL_45_11 TaxID=1797692 RepID=A0A1G1Z7G9_9BACT|nr:MAG: hypothetical protein UX16_C0008G0017 [Parcubacteria group bacterium GW2011_GWB1_45_7]OGY58681.1 MAG: hypothetical protein A3C03_02315 [Candidatus Colwellbacteria bacterium RIFCSPHIGHO2_02_FULL_45_17]OGY60464.1 MAG: hypothetical protein A3I33_02650 [Candidatus Colwellbacteria bacterium RIFCSPLOWO2_02_FULL_45_11]
MKNLTDLFKLLEITRDQPQYGYALVGIHQGDQSNLAEHHYLVTFIAWQIALHVKDAGAKIDVEKVLEFSLIHDLGELFGGDIAMPYARVNPKAKVLAKAFESENHQFLSKFFGKEKRHFLELSSEIMEAESDEALIAKIADYMELAHFRFHMKTFDKWDVELIGPKILEKISKIKDQIAKKELGKFLEMWVNQMPDKKAIDVIESGENGGNG